MHRMLVGKTPVGDYWENNIKTDAMKQVAKIEEAQDRRMSYDADCATWRPIIRGNFLNSLIIIEEP